jgi:hypothetical protein
MSDGDDFVREVTQIVPSRIARNCWRVYLKCGHFKAIPQRQKPGFKSLTCNQCRWGAGLTGGSPL